MVPFSQAKSLSVKVPHRIWKSICKRRAAFAWPKLSIEFFPDSEDQILNRGKKTAKEALAMRIHYLQHVPFEDLANIEAWAKSRGYDLSRTLLFSDEALPEMAYFDWLIIMGGPMNIYEHDKYPWLAR